MVRVVLVIVVIVLVIVVLSKSKSLLLVLGLRLEFDNSAPRLTFPTVWVVVGVLSGAIARAFCLSTGYC